MEPPASRDRSLRRLLDAAEDASPVSSLEAVTRELGAALGATSVSFLSADLSGRALVRLTHVALGQPPQDGVRHDDEERATVLPFDGGPAEQALRSQQVQVLPTEASRSWTVLAPITERGEALGLLELDLPVEPSTDLVAEVRRTAHVLGYVVIASRRHTDLYKWASEARPSACQPRSNGDCSQRRTRAKPGRSRSPRGWNRPTPSAATPSTTASVATSCTCQ